MNNDAKERLRTVTRNLAEKSFGHAIGEYSSDEEFRQALDALMDHLVNVRKRAQEVLLEKQPV